MPILLAAAATQADEGPPAWPEGATLSAGADQVLLDRPSRDVLTIGHVHLEWPAAIDDVAVARYRIFRDGRRVTDVKGRRWDRVEKQARGRWSVRAGDAAGNWSEPLAADVASPMELGLTDSALTTRPSSRDLRIRIGKRGAPPFFEKRFTYSGDGPVRMRVPGRPLEVSLVALDAKWRMVVTQGGERISTLIVDDPLSPDAGGGCHLDTDSEHNGGLWIELAVAGKEWSAAQACAQLTQPR